MGGARSGKSSWAEKLALEAGASGRTVAYLATCELRHEDGEMVARIARHRARRPSDWLLAEEPRDPAAALAALPEGCLVLVDCLSLWVSNLLLAMPEDVDVDSAADDILERVRAFLGALRRHGDALVVSNEVGCGIVPVSRLGRLYQDILGWANQEAARSADTVWHLVAGLPRRLK